MAPTTDAEKQKALLALGLDPATLANPNSSEVVDNEKKIAEDPVLSQIVNPKSGAQAGQGSNPGSAGDSSSNTSNLDRMQELGVWPTGELLNTQSTVPGPAAEDSNDATLALLYSNANLPANTFQTPERASVSDFPAYNPNTVGLLPPTPQPARTLQGYDPSNDTRFELTLPAQQPTFGADDPYPASKARLDDVDGEPRFAVLNGANKYLYTVDSEGNQVRDNDPNGSLNVSIGGGITQPTGNQAALSLLTVGTGSILARSAAQGAAVGTLAGPGGAALGATVNVLAALATVYAYEKFTDDPDEEKEPEPPARVDPGLLPDYVDPTKVNSTPGLGESGPASATPGDPLTVDTSVAPGSPSVAQPAQPSRPSPADDPETVHQQILFPSEKEGQPGVPVEGTYWSGNSLIWANGNPAGKKPGTFAPNPNKPTELNLEAVLYKLLESGIDDIDEEHRPPIMGALAVLQGTLLYRQTFLAGIELLGSPFGADTAKLTSPNKKVREDELKRLSDLGAPDTLLNAAIKTWWLAKAPVDRAKELLGEAGAIAMLETDGWIVNPRPKGNYTHDIVAVKNGQVMVIEAKGGDPGPPRPGEATVSAGPGSDTDIRAQQMTDPYLWQKLKEDAEKDPEFKKWLIDHEVWTAIENEDPSTVGYRLIKVDTDGNIIVYGSEQIPTREGIPAETAIGQTTGNGPGPTLRGISQPIPQANPIASAGNILDGLLAQAGSWIGGLVPTGLQDVTAIAHLTVPVPAVPALQPGLWSARKPANESLTVSVIQQVPPGQYVSDVERLRCMTFL
ncbi:hypothetical protein ACTWPB_28240 [Nocardia sp. IBHARD005]|uniref:hypothetical protein n=1 Tax=Nocardia sp. IBHARD005 TaxID=3457765 RepID=UPI004058A9CE